MEKLLLRDKITAVSCGTRRSYGGSQMLSDSKTMRDVGCGVVAALDLIIYLCRYHPGCSSSFIGPLSADRPFEREEYDALAMKLSRRFLPLIPGFGINGIALAAGLDVFFRKYSMPFRATWGVRRSALWSEIERMLSQNIPVIISVGPNFPLFWKKSGLKLYSPAQDGELRAACTTVAHYVTVTGMDERYLRISSWGREYYIDRAEYAEYVSKRSSAIVSNIVLVRRRKKLL